MEKYIFIKTYWKELKSSFKKLGKLILSSYAIALLILLVNNYSIHNNVPHSFVILGQILYWAFSLIAIITFMAIIFYSYIKAYLIIHPDDSKEDINLK